MMNTRKNRKAVVINSIVIGVITTLICNLLQGVFNKIPQLGKSLISTIQNYVFISAAQASPNTIIISIMEMFLGFFLSFIISYFVNYAIYNKRKKKISKLKSQISDIEDKINRNTGNYESLKIELENASQELESNKNENSSRKINILGTVSVIFTVFFVVYTTLSLVVPIILLDQFNRDIQLIKPYSDSHTIMVLESDWIKMKSLDDYNELYRVINKIKEDNYL